MRDRLARLRERDALILLGLVIAAATIRFALLGIQSFDHEEAVTAGDILHPTLLDTVSATLKTERSPPTYYVIAWAWTRLFGTGEIGLRSLSALAGTLTVPFAYAAVARLVSRRAGLIAGALVAFNPDLIWYSIQGRSYSLFVLAATIGLLCFARALGEPTKRTFAAWALASAAAMAVHYFAGFLVAGEALWLLLRSGSRRLAIAAIAATALVAVALAPLAAGQQEDQGLGIGANATNPSILGRTGETVMKLVVGEQTGTSEWHPGTFALVAFVITAVAALAAAVIGLRRGEPRPRSGALALGVIGLISLALPVALAFGGLDLLKPRNMIGSIVPLGGVVAVGLASLRSGRGGVVAAGALCSLLGVVAVVSAVVPGRQRPDWRGLVARLGPAQRPRLLIFPRTGEPLIPLYLREDELRRLPNLQKLRKKQRKDPGPAPRSLSALAVEEVVVVSDEGQDRSASVPGYRPAGKLTYREFTLRSYRAAPPGSVDLLALETDRDQRAVIDRPPRGRDVAGAAEVRHG